MVFELEFTDDAANEWRALPPELQQQFAEKLAQRLHHPRVATAALQGMDDCYKIKLRAARHRLVYRVFDARVVVQVIVVAHRDDDVYVTASQRLH